MISDNKYIITRVLIFLLVTMLVFSTADASWHSVFAQEMVKEESFPNADKPKNEEPVTLGSSACIIDAKTGYMIYGVDEHEKAYPASTTKILTGLLAMENLNMNDIVTVDMEAQEQGGSQLYLSEGEQASVESLMYGMMLPSANDAALALGKAIGGTTEKFAEMMNEKAKSIGAVNSNFVNPNGLPDDNHYTTAYDLALIAREAMKYDDFRNIVSTYEYTIPKTNMSEDRLVHNRNRLLYNINRMVQAYGETKSIKYDGVTGIKTGYTDAAQFCLVGSAERDGTEFIAVTMKTQDMNGYQDVISMLDYGFNNYKTVEIMKDGTNIDNLAVSGGTDKYAEAAITETLYATLPIDADTDDVTIVEKYNDITAPFDAGTDGGVIEAYYNDEKVGEANINTVEAMEEGHAFDGIINVIIAVAILFLIIMILRTVNKARYRRIRRKRRKYGYQK